MFTVTVTARADTRTPEKGGEVDGGRGEESAMRPPGRRARRSLRDGDRDQGTITLMLLVMFVALLALAGVVIDGGAKLDQAENANAAAEEAARAGAGMVDQARALATGSFAVDQAEAVAAARQYLARAGYRGTAAPAGRDAIRVTVTVTAPTRVLSIIGIDSMTSTGSATASLVTGVTGPGS